MSEKRIEIGTISRERFGPLNKYLDDENITDIDYNGNYTWITNVYGNRKIIEEPELTRQWYDIFCQRVADVVSKPFNKQNEVLEAETENLRITCVHESVAMTGTAVCIRKTSESPRISYEAAIRDGYAPEEVMNLLINCMVGKMNFIICGEPGAGKTEFAKFLCQFINAREKVITIEDNPEWHYKSFRPFADCIEFRINDKFDYTTALKTCMRLNPSRVMLSEVRSVEVVYLIECWMAGVKGITTLHTDDVRKIPDRILTMMPSVDAERLETNIYECLDIGILLRARTMPDGKKYRYIDQMCFFERVDHENKCIELVKGGKLISKSIPGSKVTKLTRENIMDPFDVKEEILKRENTGVAK